MASIKVTFSPLLKQRILQYAAAHDHMTELDAVRELVSLGLSSSPTDDLTMVSKQRAYNDVRKWTFNKVAETFEDIAKQAMQQIGNFKRDPES